MRRKGSLASLIGFCVLAVLGSALAFAIIVAGASVALASHQSADEMQNGAPIVPNPTLGATFNGVVTDSRCGARHMRNSGMNPAECARYCVRKGAHYVLVDGERRYTLSGNDAALEELVGSRANIMGTRQGDSIVVSAAAPASF
jgi:hypothetical protein